VDHDGRIDLSSAYLVRNLLKALADGVDAAAGRRICGSGEPFQQGAGAAVDVGGERR
jgi:hypothetical protein